MTLSLIRRLVKGTPLSAEEHDGNLDKIEAALAPMVRGQVSRTTASTISIATQSAYVPVAVTGTLDTATAVGMTLGASNLFALKNTSGSTRLMRITGAVDAADGNHHTLGIKLALNGTPIDATESRAHLASSGATASMTTTWTVSMPANSEASLVIANHSGADNIEFLRGRLVAVEIR